MIRSGIASLTLIACVGVARAELTVHELEQQPSTAEIVDFFPLAQGDLLLRVRSDPWSVVYVLTPDGTVKERSRTPWGVDRFVVPYRNGFAVQRLAREDCAPSCGYLDSGPMKILAFEHATDSEPKVLYTPGLPFYSWQLAAAPDGQDLYVLETGPQESRVVRIDASGRIVWQQTVARLASGLVATDDGVAFVKRPYDRTLCAIDRNGRLRWETSVPQIDSHEPIYSPAGFIALALWPTSPQEWDQARLLNFDVRTGQLLADVRMPAFAYAVGTQQGLLVAGPMLGQSHVGMLGRDGNFAWLRRYVADEKVSDIQRAATTADGKLLLVTRERIPTTTTPTMSLVTTESAAASLAAARGYCLDANWQQPVDDAARLHRRGLWVMPPQTAELTSNAKACSNREKEFVNFMHALAAAVPETAVQSPGTRQRIMVRVTSSGTPIRLETYSADRSGVPNAGEILNFVAPFDRAAEFWKIVATQARPHLDRMRALDERFVQMTGFMYIVSTQGYLDYARTFAELEKAARTVDARIAGIPPAQLADVRRIPPNGWVSVLLQPEGFGASADSLHPFDVADRTFLDIVAEHRRRAAQGEIIIRD